MKIKRGAREGGLTLLEVVVVLGLLLILAGLILPMLAKAKARTGPRVNCVSNLKMIGLAMRMFSNDHEDNFPWLVPSSEGGSMEYSDSTQVFRHFLVASNELSTPKVLACPNDTGRVKATDWYRLSNSNLSYFVGLDSNETPPTSVLSGDRTLSVTSSAVSGLMVVTSNSPPRVLGGVHTNAINLACADGSVQQMTEAAARNWLLFTNSTPTRLAMP